MNANASLRIPCRSRAEAKELALRLEADGYRVSRRRRDVAVRAETEEAAADLARKLGVVHSEDRALTWQPVPVGR